MDDWTYNLKTAQDRLCKHFGVKNLKGFGVAHMEDALQAAGAIMFYLEDTQHTQLGHITTISRIDEDGYVRMDDFTLRNLELLNPLSANGHSLLSVIDRTLTPMGARLLRRWIAFPLCSVNDIERRHNCVEYFVREPAFRRTVMEHLQVIGDMERLVAKLSAGRITPREMQQLRFDLEAIAPIRQACCESSLATMRDIGSQLDNLDGLRLQISKTLHPDPPSMTNKGGYIGNGVDAELDELRELSSSSKNFLQEIQRREIELTDIPSLKIGYNNVFGYYLEVRNTFKDKVPADWIRKQTLVGAERYITAELKQYEEKILGAEDRILVLEARIYGELLAHAHQHIAAIQKDAILLARLDCLHSFAAIAEERKYVRPVVDESYTLDIREGRHPVIETEMAAGEHYIPNDVLLDTEKQQIIIITGPNMAGKSALLRQTALIVLLAQAGCFVPASAAHIGLVDRIFTRVGASDNISMGESTFMVEMSEASSIISGITPRSLILFDELGRGTSTYDGISIAWAIIEYLHENRKGHPRTLFATHYHELNEMERLFPRIKNWNVSVKEVNGRIVFLRKLARGGSEHSFGIHVAKLSGMPQTIVRRAEQMLRELEANNARNGEPTKMEQLASVKADHGMQLSFFQLDDPVLSQIRDELLGLDVNRLTPLDALNKLSSIQKILSPS